MTRRRSLVAAGALLVTLGGGLADAQTPDPNTQTITVQVDATRSISLSVATPTAPTMRQSDLVSFSAGTVTYTTTVGSPGDEIVVQRADDPANPSTDGFDIAVTASGLSCGCGSAKGTAVDGDPATLDSNDPVSATTAGGDAIITAITDTGTDSATATLNYTITTADALPGSYTFTITFLIRAAVIQI